MIITIDGPTASGKSTTARAVARELDYVYINSGTLFRIVAYVLVHEFGYMQDRLASDVFAQDVRTLIADCRYEWSNQTGDRMFYKAIDYTRLIKQGNNDAASSILGLNIQVRNQIVPWIRAMADHQNIVIDGRDAGTVIFPHAELKIYLTADLSIRTLRWIQDQQARGVSYSYEQAMKLIAERDERDTKRPVAPLAIASDAIIIDSSHMNQEQVVREIINRVTLSLS